MSITSFFNEASDTRKLIIEPSRPELRIHLRKTPLKRIPQSLVTESIVQTADDHHMLKSFDLDPRVALQPR
jgi:hypothetical protein